MAELIRVVDYFTTVVHDRPGEGSWILSRIQEAGVTLAGACGFPLGRGRAQLSLIPMEPGALVAAAEACEFGLSRAKRAFLIQGEIRPGAVAGIYHRLERKAINIVAAQAVSAGEGRFGMMLWVKPAEVDRAARALGIERS